MLLKIRLCMQSLDIGSCPVLGKSNSWLRLIKIRILARSRLFCHPVWFRPDALIGSGTIFRIWLLSFRFGANSGAKKYNSNRRFSDKMASSAVRALEGKIALVTGASRGIGKGIALQLARAGATVYITGRAPAASFSMVEKGLPSLEQTAKEIEQRGGLSHAVYCDHANTDDVRRLFKRIEEEQSGRLHILVNNAYSGVPSLIGNAGKKFWECDAEFWDDINEVGLRNVYFCSTLAARLMVPHGEGLIVHISSAGALQYLFSVPYGVGKAAIDRMAADMALELKPRGVAVISLWPGFVQTEFTLMEKHAEQFSTAAQMSLNAFNAALQNAESPDFVGKAVVGLAKDPKILQKSGRIQLTGDLATEYAFTDQNGVVPTNIRSIRSALQFFGWLRLAKLVPAFIKTPKFGLHFASYKF